MTLLIMHVIALYVAHVPHQANASIQNITLPDSLLQTYAHSLPWSYDVHVDSLSASLYWYSYKDSSGTEVLQSAQRIYRTKLNTLPDQDISLLRYTAIPGTIITVLDIVGNRAVAVPCTAYSLCEIRMLVNGDCNWYGTNKGIYAKQKGAHIEELMLPRMLRVGDRWGDEGEWKVDSIDTVDREGMQDIVITIHYRAHAPMLLGPAIYKWSIMCGLIYIEQYGPSRNLMYVYTRK